MYITSSSSLGSAPETCRLGNRVSSDCVIVLDLRNRIVDLNPAAKRLVGLPDPKVIGRPIVQALGDYAELAGPLRDTNMVQSEIVLERNDAREYYDLQISPLTSPFGDPIGRLVVLHNITGRPGRLSLLEFNIGPD